MSADDDRSTSRPAWQDDLDRSIWAWRARKPGAGLAAAGRVLADVGSHEEARHVARANATWYAPTLAAWVPGVRFSPLRPPVAPGWSRFNPSIIAADGRLITAVRSSNYRLDDGGGYRIDDPEGVVRTTTYLVELAEDLRPGTVQPIRAATPRAPSTFPVHGWEDLRLARIGGRLLALGTVRDLDESGTCTMVVLELSPSGEVVREMPIAGPVPGRHEKNWVPFDAVTAQGRAAGRASQLAVVYGWDPLVVGWIDVERGRWTEVERRSSPIPGAGMRGGTQGVAVPGGVLFVVHDQVWLDGSTRRYPHRFVLLGDDGTFRSSPPFFFLRHGIEFAAGLATVGDRLVISFGVEDAEAWLATVDTAAVLVRLTPVPESFSTMSPSRSASDA